MEYTDSHIEKNNKRKSRTISIVLHLLLLLLIFLFTFPAKRIKPIDPPPVTVQFDFRESKLTKYAREEKKILELRESSTSKKASAAEGAMRKKQPQKAAPKKSETPTPTPNTIEVKKTNTKVTPTPARVKKSTSTKITKPTTPKPVEKPVKIVSTTTTPLPSPVITEKPNIVQPVLEPEIEDVEPEIEDTPIEFDDTEIDIDTETDIVEQEELSDEDLAELEREAEIPVEEPVRPSKSSKSDSEINSEWDGTGISKKNPNSVDESTASGTGKGDKGSGPGASEGNDKDHGVGQQGSGTGEFDGSGRGVFGRRITYSNWREAVKGQSQGKGTVVVKFCVNPQGDVVYSEIIEDETTETDPKKLKQVLKATRGYKLQAKADAPDEQCGKMRFSFNINGYQHR